MWVCWRRRRKVAAGVATLKCRTSLATSQPPCQLSAQDPAASAAAGVAEQSPAAEHYATLGELHTHGLTGLAKRNPELLEKIAQYAADATIEDGLSSTQD